MAQLIGHLHPLVVHLPIGFILLAICLEWYLPRRGQPVNNQISRILWFLSALTSIVAVITGLVLVDSGRYEGFHVFLHRWTAISIAIITSLLFIIKWKQLSLFKSQGIILKIIVVTLLIVAGHKGGEITHGFGYLPIPFVKNKIVESGSLSDRDSVQLYQDIISPILTSKCAHCHEDGDERGRMNVQSQEGLLSDVFGDPGIMPGDITKSEIFKRVTLSSENEKFMPPSGPQLTYSEIRIIEYWISSGASFTDYISPGMEIPEEVQNLLNNSYGINFEEKSLYEKLIVSEVSIETLDEVRSADFGVNNIATGNPLLEVSRKGFSKDISSDQLEKLLLIKEQITWLDLADTNITDEIASALSQMPNITKLKLQNTDVGDGITEALYSLKNVQMINLYNSNLTDDGLFELAKMPSLKSLYIWQTSVSEEAVEKVRSIRSDLNIVGNLSNPGMTN